MSGKVFRSGLGRRLGDTIGVVNFTRPALLVRVLVGG